MASSVSLLFFLLCVTLASGDSKEEESNESASRNLRSIFPSDDALQIIGVQFLDALIKRGQMEMAKSAFKTQLEVLEKVQPEQYKKYKKIPVDELAADAIMQQAEMAQFQPKTGNRLVDMLHENGIPIASSIKGIEQAIRTQREIENSDPAEQIAKAVLEKFQKQILPVLVANIIAGKNPFQIAPREEVQRLTDVRNRERVLRMQHEDAIKELRRQQLKQIPKVQSQQFDLNEIILPRHSGAGTRSKQKKTHREIYTVKTRKPIERAKISPRLASLLKRLAERRQLRDEPPPQRDSWEDEPYRRKPLLTPKEALLFGVDQYGESVDEEDDDPEEEKWPTSSRRFSETQNEKDRHNSRRASPVSGGVSSIEKYLEPKRMINNPNPQPGYFLPRRLPKRRTRMLPLTVGVRPEDEGLREFSDSISDLDSRPSANGVRRSQARFSGGGQSRVLENLRNNPALTALFEDPELLARFSRSSVLTDSQRGQTGQAVGHTVVAYPRLALAAKTRTGKPSPLDYATTQLIEERPVPPLFPMPKGRHTRIRFTGATEKEVPGLGGRFVMPSLDPTMPALNSMVSSQGKQRDEYDSIFKVPNNWQSGDTIGIHTKTRSERFFGGNGAAESPAMGIHLNDGR